MTAIPSEAAIKLVLLKWSANDPKRTLALSILHRRKTTASVASRNLALRPPLKRYTDGPRLPSVLTSCRNMTNPNNDREALGRHIRDSHPMVYLTLVSIIVALALEDLFSQVREIYALAGPDATSVLLWLQIIGAFSTALGVWVGYCHILITTRWILGIWDALSVMSLLVSLFLINTTVGAANPGWWFFAIGVHALAGGGILYVNLRRAMKEPNVVNDALPAPNSWSFFHLMITGGLTVILGLVVFSGVVSAFIISLFAAAVVVLVVSWSFVWVNAWRKSVGLS